MTITELIARVREEANKRPNNVYRPDVKDRDDLACFYNSGVCSDGTIGCIFGQILSVNSYHGCLSIERVLEGIGMSASDDQILWCTMVQNHQDRGHTWSECVRYADGM